MSDADYWAGVHGSLSSAGFMQAALRGQHWWRRRDPVHGRRCGAGPSRWETPPRRCPRILNALSKAWRSPEGDDLTQALKTQDADGRTLWAWAFGHGWGRWNRKFQDAPFGRTIAGHQEGTWAEVIRPLCSPLNAQGEGLWVQMGWVSGTVFPFRPGTSARTLLGSGSRPGHADLLNPHPEMWWGGAAARQEEACTRLFLNDFRLLGKSGEFATELRSWGDLIPPPASDSAPAAHALWALGQFLQGAQGAHQDPQREEWFARFAQEYAPALIKGAPSEWWASGALRGVDPNSPELARWSDAALAVRMGAVMEEGEAGRRRL